MEFVWLLQHRLYFDNYTRHFVPFPISTFALCSVHRTSVIKRPTVDYCVILKKKIPVEYAMQLLSMHNTAEHDAAPPAPPIPPSAARKAKADRPSIDMGVTTERWVYFQKRWNTYKISTGIAGADIQGQLMDTCSEQLRYVMFQDNNDIEQQPELHILESIRRLAVKAENVMVSRVVLNNLQQQADEGIRNFTARVKGQADLCQFTKQCTCTNTVRYTDEMVRDVIIRGLYDQDTQRDVLGMQEQDMQLDALIKLLEAKEIGKKTQTSILGETGASISRYKRDKNPSRADDQNKPGKCHYCGRAGLELTKTAVSPRPIEKPIVQLSPPPATNAH